MRGVPKEPVECTNCHEVTGCKTDGLCSKCRAANLGRGCVKYPWTPADDEYLRRIYADHRHHKPSLTRAITAFADRKRYPRYIIRSHATRQGLTMDTRKPWSAEEFEALREMAGSSTAKQIARQLNRSHSSVVSMMEKLKISRQVLDGYSRVEVQQVFGVSSKTVQQWIKNRWLRVMPGTDRITETSMVRFITNHPGEYSLGRVDETWYKSRLFPSFGFRHNAERDPSSEVEEVAFA